MYCFQCQEAINGIACKGKAGFCGKTDEVADLQDLLIYMLKGISIVNLKARELGVANESTDKLIFNGLFQTITNGNFDRNVFIANIKKAVGLRDQIIKDIVDKGGKVENGLHESVYWTPENDDEILKKSEEVGVLTTENEDVRSLRELIVYGVKGMAAYAEHAFNLGYKDQDINKFMQKALAATTDDSLSADELVALVLETGKFGVEVMALLDKANTSSYGNPEISEVNLGVRNNPAILVSGHDLKDLEQLLKQTEGTGVDVYTHSEMLPAHYYPAFKKYDNFVGNYGSSWWNQVEEFETFNGPVLFTTNCLVPPRKSATYTDRIYTTGPVGFEGFPHIPDPEDGKEKDFSKLIEHAKKTNPPKEIETGKIVGGFAHNQVLQLADKIVDAVKTGAIKKFFVMAGCDGRMKSREYYTEFAQKLPKDTVILTAGCAKYRYNKLPLGDIGGIPRVLDAGQCNDSYSLAVIALKLKEVFELNDINELPIEYNIAWYEQKAVIVLLALLYLGVKDIHLGPTLPAFLSPGVAKVIQDNFGIKPIGNVDDDIRMLMN
jgi:hydroxylamine reductase